MLISPDDKEDVAWQTFMIDAMMRVLEKIEAKIGPANIGTTLFVRAALHEIMARAHPTSQTASQ